MNHPIRIAQVIDSLNQLKGGPSLSCSRLSESLLSGACEVATFSNHYPEFGVSLLPSNTENLVFEANWLTRIGLGIQPSMYQALMGPVGLTIDLVHTHGLWLAANRYARIMAEKREIPLVISPRGMLEDWALKRSAWKKQCMLLIAETKNLKKASCFHATSIQEYKSIRSFGLDTAIAVIPNGVDIPDAEAIPPRSSLVHWLPELGMAPYVLFLSRLHPKKGLETLLKLTPQIKKDFPNIHFVIAGTGDVDYCKQLQSFVDSVTEKPWIHFTGYLHGAVKSAALAHAEVFILPSLSENFGIVVAEALAHKTPVITTHETPWQSLVERGCGWWVPCGGESLKNALFEALEMSDNDRKEMGERGRKFIAEEFAWSDIACRMESVYRWLIYGDNKPSCVI